MKTLNWQTQSRAQPRLLLFKPLINHSMSGLVVRKDTKQANLSCLKKRWHKWTQSNIESFLTLQILISILCIS